MLAVRYRHACARIVVTLQQTFELLTDLTGVVPNAWVVLFGIDLFQNEQRQYHNVFVEAKDGGGIVTVGVYTDHDQSTTLHEAETLTGGAVLAGFTLPLRELFGELDQEGIAM
jgi:hypothetical protein